VRLHVRALHSLEERQTLLAERPSKAWHKCREWTFGAGYAK
jgi:hypothetical protein